MLADDPAFTGRSGIGTLLIDVKLDDGFLSDRLGRGFTVWCFDKPMALQIRTFFAEFDNITVVTLPQLSPASSRLAGGASSAYLIRPDMYIAGRWFAATIQGIIDGYRKVTFHEEACQ